MADSNKKVLLIGFSLIAAVWVYVFQGPNEPYQILRNNDGFFLLFDPNTGTLYENYKGFSGMYWGEDTVGFLKKNSNENYLSNRGEWSGLKNAWGRLITPYEWSEKLWVSLVLTVFAAWGLFYFSKDKKT